MRFSMMILLSIFITSIFIVAVYRNIVKRHTGTVHGQAEGNALQRKFMSG
jgi:hypothetical protein